MNLFRNVVFIAAIAGLVAGVVLACMQAYATVPLILKAEVYEKAGGGHHHDHAHHHHGHAHSHGPATPHPAQAAPWSILRMTVTARLAAALAVSAALWAVVLVAMR